MMLTVEADGAGAALLIDADNFQQPAHIEAAHAQLKARVGRVGIVRAYGGGTKLLALGSVWRALGARIFPNLALDKNTTDAALVADAVALHFQHGVRRFGIASGDADFAPLAVRLREWGCEVMCFADAATLFDGAEAFYDRVVRFETPAPAPTVVAPRAPEPAVPAVPAATATASACMATLPAEVRRILRAVPALREKPQHLSQVAAALRKEGVLGKNAKSTTLFKAQGQHFRLSPVAQPNAVTFVPSTSMSSGVRTQTGTSPSFAPVPKVTGISSERAVELPVLRQRQVLRPLSRVEIHRLRVVISALALKKVTVADVLLAVPEFLSGRPHALPGVASRLRERGLLRPQGSALRLLERHPASFEIVDAQHPVAVRYRG